MVEGGIPDRGTSTSKDTENICPPRGPAIPKPGIYLREMKAYERSDGKRVGSPEIQGAWNEAPSLTCPATSSLAKFLGPALLSFVSETLHVLFLLSVTPSSIVIS